MSPYFDDLFKSNYRKLVVISYRYTKRKTVAEEVVQDVFVDFWGKLKRKQKILNHEAYLSRATVLRSLDTLKKERKYDSTEDDTLEILVNNSSKNSSELYYMSSDAKTKLRKAIIELPARTSEVFLLSKYENFTHNEISEVLDISNKTVEYHITKGLSLLRKALICWVLYLFSCFFIFSLGFLI